MLVVQLVLQPDYYDPIGEDPADINPGHESGTYNSQNVGGIVGYGKNVKLGNVHNQGNIFGEENVGGLAGQMDNGSIKGSNFNPSYNNAQVTGKENVGGLVGFVAGDVLIENAFNTNESSPLNPKSQVWVDADGKIVDIGGGYVNTTAVDVTYYKDGEVYTLPDDQIVLEEIDEEGMPNGKLYLADKETKEPIHPEGQPDAKIYVTEDRISKIVDYTGKEITIEGFIPNKGISYNTVTKFNKPCLVDLDGNFIVYHDTKTGEDSYVFANTYYEWKEGDTSLEG